ncbi:MAG: cobalamin biosynthesis protein, partial [Pseudomonadota bacterium]
MNTFLVLVVAMALDGALGEPKWLWDRLPHPAVLMGRAVGYLDKTLNNGSSQWVKGVLTLIVLVAGAWLLGVILAQFGW